MRIDSCGLVADDLRLRPDPGSSFPLHVRIFWQHAETHVTEDDLDGLKGSDGTLEDAQYASGSL